MKLGSLPRGLAVAAVAAVTVLPLAAAPAGAAPAAPTAYTLFGGAEPLVWGGSSSAPVGALHVPFVRGKTTNLAIAKSDVKLADPDENVKPLSGETIHGITCTNFDPKFCNKDTLTPLALAEHKGPDAHRSEQAAFFTGKDGRFPGSIRAVTDCPGQCGEQLVRSLGSGIGPAGGLAGYVTVGSSFASHDLSIDDKGRLVSTARSELTDVSIGPKNEVRFSKLETTAQGWGSGAPNSKDGRADLRIMDFFILDYQVELTRAGLKLANAGPSEQEAYDGAKALLKQLRERGIRLELPNFDAQIVKTSEHVAVETRGLTVWFDRSVGSVAADAINYPLDLGHATSVVAALDVNRNIEVNENQNGDVVVQTTAPPPAQVAAPGPAPSGGPAATGPRGNGSASSGRGTSTAGPSGGKPGATRPTTPGSVTSPAPVPSVGDQVPAAPVEPAPSGDVVGDVPAPVNPDETALPSFEDVQRNLGLRSANSVSRAFGAFLGLGLILPLARIVIRRLG